MRRVVISPYLTRKARANNEHSNILLSTAVKTKTGVRFVCGWPVVGLMDSSILALQPAHIDV